MEMIKLYVYTCGSVAQPNLYPAQSHIYITYIYEFIVVLAVNEAEPIWP